jgi:putative ABC transport system permease protein
MLVAALRDLQWRRRRFIITAIGTALVFAMSLLLSGLAEAFRDEGRAWIRSMGADVFVVDAGQAGPLTGFSPIEEARVDEVGAIAAVEQASGFLKTNATLDLGGIIDVNVFGVELGGLGWPEVRKGVLPRASGEGLVDESLGLDVGDQVRLHDTTVTVVGTISGSTLNGGIGNVYLPLPDVQRLFLGGLPAVTIILVRGTPGAPIPTELTAFDADEALDDLLRPLGDARRSIDFVRVLLWIVAACIIGSVVYLTALERTRDFAVFKAVGTSPLAIGAGLALQAVILALVSALLAAVVGSLLSPLFPLPVHIPRRAFLALPVVAVIVGLVASLVGLRRAVRVPPSVAFGAP